MPVVKRTVVLLPEVDKLVRKLWALFIEEGYDTTYSTALNILVLQSMYMADVPKELVDKLISTILEKGAIEEIDTMDALARVEETLIKMLKEVMKTTDTEARRPRISSHRRRRST